MSSGLRRECLQDSAAVPAGSRCHADVRMARRIEIRLLRLEGTTGKRSLAPRAATSSPARSWTCWRTCWRTCCRPIDRPRSEPETLSISTPRCRTRFATPDPNRWACSPCTGGRPWPGGVPEASRAVMPSTRPGYVRRHRRLRMQTAGFVPVLCLDRGGRAARGWSSATARKPVRQPGSHTGGDDAVGPTCKAVMPGSSAGCTH